MKDLTTEDFDSWMSLPETEAYIQKVYAEVLYERRGYDTISEDIEVEFPRQQGRVRGLSRAIHIAYELADIEIKEE